MGLQPKLDVARYKAEAGLSRRGFVNHGDSSLWHEEGEDHLVASGSSSVREDSTGDPSVDSDDGGLGQDLSALDVSANNDALNQRRDTGVFDSRGRSASAGRASVDVNSPKPRRPWEVPRDEMKWPAGEGWKPLS